MSVETITLTRVEVGTAKRWQWHVNFEWTEGVHGLTWEGIARWKWLARYRAERRLDQLKVQHGT